MTHVVTGATGPFGRHAVEALLRRGVPAADVVAVGRDPGRLAALAGLGVTVRPAAYDDPGALHTAFAGAHRLLFVSGSEVGRRVEQHRAVVEAAVKAGVELVAYTSIAHADTSDLLLAAEHRATEELLTASGLPAVFLRNSWYLENWTADLPAVVEHGLVGAAGDGRISGAARADFAEAAAAVLTGDGHAGRAYELGGPAFTLAGLAAEISRVAGREVPYTDLTPQRYAEALTARGLPPQVAQVIADADRGAAQGLLEVPGDDLARLAGRPLTPVGTVLRAALG